MLIFVPFVQWEKFRDFSLIVINSRKDFFLLLALHSLIRFEMLFAYTHIYIYISVCVCVCARVDVCIS